jgi:putative transposase
VTPRARRSSPRLAGFDYRGGYRYHIVLVTHARRRVLVGAWATRAVEELRAAALRFAFTVDAFCVMPDHLHALVTGDAAHGSDLKDLVHAFKQRIGYSYRRECGVPLWQRSYFDHVLRADEPAELHAAYIVGNPVRAGLARTSADWPFSGPRQILGADADRSEDLSLRLAELSRTIGLKMGRRSS